MRRAAPWLLLVVGIFLLLSAAAHGFAGWPGIRGELVKAQVEEGLIRPIGIGWLYGSAAMLGFGVIVLLAWRWARAGEPAAAGIVAPISLVYLGFGTSALVYTSFNPHFLGFVIPGLLLAVAWYGLRDRTGRGSGD